jgi:extracellular factor (EF) 3-hydroxypalmitic acid methyl ester biosynthesis protein
MENKELLQLKETLPKLYLSLKEYGPIDEKSLNAEFTAMIAQLKRRIIDIKRECDSFDSCHPNRQDRIDHVNKIKSYIFSGLNMEFGSLAKVIDVIKKSDYRRHQLFAQMNICGLIATSPLNKRIYEKPLGYPGDFETINYYYEDGYEGVSSFDILLHRYSIELDVARAHINRKPYFVKKIDGIVKKHQKQANITSFGCGSAIEVLEYMEKYQPGNKVVFNLVDSEKLALDQIKNGVAKIDPAGKTLTHYYGMDILALLKKSTAYDGLKNQDLIYAAGLFDYFKDKMAKAILRRMFDFLAEDGEMIIVNVSKDHNAKVYMEFFGEWYLNLRNESELLSLTEGIQNIKSKHVEKDAENGKNLYLVLRK